MMSEANDRDADETTFNRFMELAEGDEFTALGSGWIVENVENDPRNHARVITAGRLGREHEWVRFTAESAALTVTAELHDDAHERDAVENTKHVSGITVQSKTATDGGESEGEGEDVEKLKELAKELEQDADEYGRLGDADRVEITVEYETKSGNTRDRSGEVWCVECESDGSVNKIRFSENAGEADEDPYYVDVERGSVFSVSETGTKTELGPVTAFGSDREDTEDSGENGGEEPMTDGGDDVVFSSAVSPAALSELDVGEELTIQIDHEPTGQKREYKGTVADHPYSHVHDDWAVVLEDVERNTSGYSPTQRGHYVVYTDGSVESRPCASRQVDIGAIRAVVTPITPAADSDGEDAGGMTEDGEPVTDGGSRLCERLETELIESLSGTRLEVSATDHHAYSGAKVMGVDGDELVYGGPVWSPSVEDPEATSKFAEFKFSTVEPGDVFQFGVHYDSPGFEDRDEADLLAHHSYLKDAEETLFIRVQDGEVEVISEDEVFQHITGGQADE